MDILDPICFIAIFLFAISVSLNIIYIGDPVYGDLANRSVALIALAVLGVAAETFLAIAEPSPYSGLVHTSIVFIPLDQKSTKIILTWLVIGFVGILILNISLGSLVSGSILLPYIVFGTASAVGEELFFLPMQSITWEILRFSKTLKRKKVVKEAISIIVISIIFTYFHIVVYAGNIQALAYVLVLRIIASVQFQITRRFSIPILTHLINNAISLLRML